MVVTRPAATDVVVVGPCGYGCGSRGDFRTCNGDIYLFELNTHLFELKTLIRSNCASSNFDLVGSCAYSIITIAESIMSAQSLSQPYRGCSPDDDSSCDWKAMSHRRGNGDGTAGHAADGGADADGSGDAPGNGTMTGSGGTAVEGNGTPSSDAVDGSDAGGGGNAQGSEAGGGGWWGPVLGQGEGDQIMLHEACEVLGAAFGTTLLSGNELAGFDVRAAVLRLRAVRKAMSHRRSKPVPFLQATVIFLLPTHHMSSRRRQILAPEIRREGGEVTDDPSIATHCIVPYTVDEERMKELCAKYGVPDTCKCVPESFLFTDPDVLQEREAALAQTTDGGPMPPWWPVHADGTPVTHVYRLTEEREGKDAEYPVIGEAIRHKLQPDAGDGPAASSS